MRIQGSVGLFFLVAGCAQMPPVDFSYYPSKGAASVAVIQSFDCSADKKRLVIATTPPTVSTSYFADHGVGPWTIEVSRTRGEFTDTDFTITYYEDGRLKGINAVSTGQGEAVLKSAISLATAALPLVGGAGTGGSADPVLPVCDVIANWGKGKPVTLTFSAPIDFAQNGDGAPVNLSVSFDGVAMFTEMQAGGQVVAPQVTLTVGTTPIVPVASAQRKDGEYVKLKLQKVYPADLKVTASGTAIWAGKVLVPKADYYELPIPKAALFGKTTVVVAVAESGAVTSLQYGRTTGDAGALNVLTAAATAMTPDTAAAKAADVKAQADLIVQSQRLARCQAQPDQCQ